MDKKLRKHHQLQFFRSRICFLYFGDIVGAVAIIALVLLIFYTKQTTIVVVGKINAFSAQVFPAKDLIDTGCLEQQNKKLS